MRNLSLNQKIFLPLTLVIGTTFFLSYELSAWLQRDLALKLVSEKVDNVANTYMDQLNVLMVTGTIANRQIVQTKLKSEPGVVEARLIRAPAITSLFGPGHNDQHAVDAWDRRALESGEQIMAQQGERLTLIKPFKAYKEYRGTQCLMCHQVSEGTVLGAVRITYDLSATLSEIRHNNWLLIGTLTAVFGLGFVVLGWVLQRYIRRPIQQLQGTVIRMAQQRDLSLPLPVASRDEIGHMTQAVGEMVQGFRASLSEVEHATQRIYEESAQISQVAANTESCANMQDTQTRQVADAVGELDHCSGSVRSHSQQNAELSALTDRDAGHASELAHASIHNMSELSEEIGRIDRVIKALDERCLAVDGVLEVIKAIADQTNLLALNAAIEAARAGEQGRGFAVVADEVRALSSRSRSASEEIAQMIRALQSEAQSAVDVISDAEHKAAESIGKTRDTLAAMQTIIDRIANINDLNNQMAESAEQQNRVCHNVTLSVGQIRDTAHQTLDQARSASSACQQLVELSARLEALLKTYRW
jgi:methyl-accepting chemotaxis protein